MGAMAGHRVTDTDLDRWVSRGLITAQQRHAILSDLEAREPEKGLTVTSLLYYTGGIIVLVAYGIFLGVQWEGMNETARMAIAAVSFVVVAALSQALVASERFRLPGELLQLVAVAVVALLVFSVMDAAGWWPEDRGYSPFDGRGDYSSDLTWARMALTGSMLFVGAVAFAISRSPFVLVAALGSTVAFVIDASLQIEGRPEGYIWETPQVLMVSGCGVALIVAGLLSRDRTERDYTTWLYLLGLAALAAGLGVKAFGDETSAFWGAVWMAGAVTVLVLSVPLQQRLFAAAGLLGVLAYLARLVFDVFESPNAALVLVVIGLIVLGSGALYQRYSDRLFPPKEA
jgi:hypothetical protein